jgi:hypothetical protein
MITQDTKNSLPCLLQNEQPVIYIFSQPRNSAPSYFKNLLSGDNYADLDNTDIDPTSSLSVASLRLHRVALGVGRRTLTDDVSISEIESYLLPLYFCGFRRTHFLISSKSVNLLLEAAARSMILNGGLARCADYGIVYSRDLRKGEICYLLELSRTPEVFMEITKLLGHIG